MDREVEVKHLGSNITFYVDRFPNKCGLCHNNIDPKYISGAFIRPTAMRKDEVSLVFQCTNVSCNNLIIGYYVKDPQQNIFIYEKTAPKRVKENLFQEEIRSISENFVKIYNQASHAEQIGLNLISGIGYRKALEFLVKDYLIHLNPDNEQEILEKQLSPCINILDNHNIKEIARRASWLGNDEAHYLKKWEDKDITDLKKLIEVTVYFITMDVSAKKYLEDMK